MRSPLTPDQQNRVSNSTKLLFTSIYYTFQDFLHDTWVHFLQLPPLPSFTNYTLVEFQDSLAKIYQVASSKKLIKKLIVQFRSAP